MSNNNIHYDNINWFPGHMFKGIKEINKKIKFVDLLIEVLDIRMPTFSSNNFLNSFFINNKKDKLLILNKKDLADPLITEKWIKYFNLKKINYLLLNSKNDFFLKKLINKINKILNNNSFLNKKKQIINNKINILIYGIPNVGKSTFINSLIKKNVAKTNNSPGTTKKQQIFKLNNNINLIDTPGILWPKKNIYNNNIFFLTFINSIKNKILPKNEIFFYLFKWMYKNYNNLLLNYYNFNNEKILNLNDNYLINNLFFDLINNKLNKFYKTNLDFIINDFLNKIFNNKFGLISFEKPNI